jgi:P27 family predicted phage terminase small subunit
MAKGRTWPSELNYQSPAPRDRGPVMPRDMDEVARKVWRHVMREMAGTNVILGADADVLRLYCEAMSRYLGAQRHWGQPILNDRGHLVKNPLHQVIRDNGDLVIRLARELGLSPSARAGLRMDMSAPAAGVDAEIGPPPRLRVVNEG